MSTTINVRSSHKFKLTNENNCLVKILFNINALHSNRYFSITILLLKNDIIGRFISFLSLTHDKNNITKTK